MGDTERMIYSTNSSAETYREWNSAGRLSKFIVEHVNLKYFGDLTGARIAEFGCGNGLFLKKCLKSGASFCLGLDLNETMISAGGNIVNKQIDANEQLCFMTQDCFQPMEHNYGRFDFALCQFLLHACNNEAKMETFLKNAIGVLKPGGKLFIGQGPYVSNTPKDQEIYADLNGNLLPLRSDTSGDDPYFAEVPAYRPAPKSVSETGRPFTREHAFTFSVFYWSKEKLMANLRKVGFVNVTLLPPTFPADVPFFEKEQIESLGEPFCLIGAEKPQNLP